MTSNFLKSEQSHQTSNFNGEEVHNKQEVERTSKPRSKINFKRDSVTIKSWITSKHAMLSMEFSVTRISVGQVVPLQPTPSGVLELSVIDRIPVLRCNARTLHVFRHGPGAAQVIRKALSKALVHYYPLAGRLHASDQNELQIACSGEGIWFVEAEADCTLDAVNCFDDAMSIPYDELLPTPPHEHDGLDPLVQMQVTQFECKGFVIGLIFCHSICDGLGAAQFLNAVGEMARGAEKLSIPPEWRRDFLPPPPASATPPPPPPPIPIPDYQLEHAAIDISLDRIKDLKQEYQEWSGGGSCSTFEIVAAMLWRQRTLAIQAEEETEMNLVFFANCRQLVEPPLGKGFYGNCFFPVSITASSETLTRKKWTNVVKLIQEAKTGVPNEFSKWINNSYGAGPFSPPLGYTTLFISEWGRLGFGEVDYGWGRAAHIVPIQGSTIIPIGIVSAQPAPGVRMMTWCVHEAHMQQLTHYMQQL